MAEGPSIQLIIKADEKLRNWKLRVGHEFKDLSQKVSEVLKWSDFTASFDGHVWEPDGEPPSKGKTVTVSERVHGGAPPKAAVWDPQFVPINQVLHPSFEWTNKAKLSPEQVSTNERVLDVLERATHIEGAPLYCGHILRMVEDLANNPFPHPEQQAQRGVLGPGMTIRDILRQLPISLWPPARPGQCFHPECKQRSASKARRL
jgi:hypothetical protein